MSKTVTVSTSVQYRRWQAPNFATMETPPRPRQEGLQWAPTTPIAELPREVLDALAQAWLDDLYAKANVSAPVIKS
jgi:hypothetical protein